MPAEEQPHHISTDQPLSNPDDDKLDRNRFSQEIAKSLANWKGDDSLVVSLSGEWGSGKSTIKNFVIHHLGVRATPVEFNPWQWSGQDKLLEAFLWRIGAELGKKDIAKETRKLGQKWKAFASFTKLGGDLSSISQKLFISLLSLSAVTSWITSTVQSVPWIKWAGFGISILFLSLSIITALMEKTSTALGDWSAFKEKSLEDLRSEIEVEMRKLKKPIVVFVDDIDRLTKNEIKLLIQLVKANAQFPNLVYFLLFQKNIVVKALGEITCDEGEKYLRKIVQEELDVPSPSEKQMQDLLLAHGLENIFQRIGAKMRWDTARWQGIFLDDLWPYFATLRDIKRFLGSFEFYFTLHVNSGVLEVNPVDLIAIEILRMFNHDAFLELSQSFWADERSLRGLLFRSKDVHERFKEQVQAISENHGITPEGKVNLKSLLQKLFPQSVSVDSHGDSTNSWRRDFRVCDEMAFYKYFQVTIDPGKPTASDIARFIEISNDRAQLVATLNASIERKTLEDLLDFIFVTREDISLSNVRTVATALFDIGDRLPEPKTSMFGIGLDMQCHRILYHRLKAENQDESTEILWRAHSDTVGFYLPIYDLSFEDRRTRERAERTSFLISEGRLNDFIDLELGRIRAKAGDLTLLDQKCCAFVLYRWRDWAGVEEASGWVRGLMPNSRNALAILRHLVSEITVNGTVKVPVLHGDAVEIFVPIEDLNSAVAPLSLTELSEEDRTNLNLLAKAVLLKASGKPYQEVRLDDSDI